MDRAYAASYRALYERHWWWRARERILSDVLSRITPGEGWGRILDVGCGDGLFFRALRAWGEVEGVEPDPAVVTDLGRSEGVIHQVPFDEGFQPECRYGLILLLDMLEHVDRPEAALRRAGELLAPGGRLLITVPAFELIWTSHDDLNEHRTRYTKKSLEGLVGKSGVIVEEMAYVFQALFVVKLLMRLVEAFRHGEPDVPRIPAQPLNGLVEDYCYWERRLLGPLHPPFGSSLLCVARAG